MPKVALISGQKRYQNIYQALGLIKDEIKEKIAGKQKIVIKPNLCVRNNQLAITHVEAVKTLLDFLIKEEGIDISKVTIAEGPFDGPLKDSLKNYGYLDKLANYPVKFIDLNYDDFQEFKIFWNKKHSVKIKLAKTILDSDFIISICPPKTHDSVITTLTLKNLLVGAIVMGYLPIVNSYSRFMIHGSPYKINKILFELAKIIKPDLAIIDGLIGMEGNGPTSADAKEFNLALAGTDAITVDSLCSYLMGFNPQDIGYLYYCGQAHLGENNLSKIKIIGIGDIEQYKKQFKPHYTFKEQLEWQIPENFT